MLAFLNARGTIRKRLLISLIESADFEMGEKQWRMAALVQFI